ncbi:MAG TPA: hypothetical protein VGC87_22445 [Pyrinomonadaceae bacterium]|jgi:hypothetical protein
MKKRRAIIMLCALCCVAGLALAYPAAEAKVDSRMTINGTVYAIGGGRRAGNWSGPFRLIVNRYTTAGEARELNDALQQGGQDGLLKALSRMDAGRIQVGTGVGVTANAVIADQWGEGGTKLTVFYERNVRFFELRYGTRSQDYPVGYAEIFLDRNGKGEGTFIPAARVRLRDGNAWEVEDFGVFPARLMGLRASGRVTPG